MLFLYKTLARRFACCLSRSSNRVGVDLTLSSQSGDTETWGVKVTSEIPRHTPGYLPSTLLFFRLCVEEINRLRAWEHQDTNIPGFPYKENKMWYIFFLFQCLSWHYIWSFVFFSLQFVSNNALGQSTRESVSGDSRTLLSLVAWQYIMQNPRIWEPHGTSP